MKFQLNRTIEMLEQTPVVLYAFLQDISGDWVYNKEGKDTPCVFDVVGI